MSPAARRRRSLEVSVSSDRPGPAAPGLARWLERVAPRTARGSVSIAVVTDAAVRRLNRRYRRKDRPTDVLSFPSGEQAFLGDIVIARGIARRQARERGHSYAVELKVLALHGLLHLLGYDHEGTMGRWPGWSAGSAAVAGCGTA